MDSFSWWVIGGVLLAGVTIFIARAVWTERKFFSVGLVVLGGWYVGFGLIAGTAPSVLLPQLLGGLAFAVFGVVGLRGSLFAVSLGWTLHAFWDLASPAFSDVAYMPEWTIPACLGYDILLGGFFLARTLGDGNAHQGAAGG